MTIIVKHRKTDESFVLLGCGQSEYQAIQPGMIAGSLNPEVRSGTTESLCVSDKNGQIRWVESADLYVASVAGKPVGQAIAEADEVDGNEVMLVEANNVTPEEVIRYLEE